MNLKVLLIEVALLSLAHRLTLCHPTPSSAGASLPITAETETEPAQSSTSVQVEENTSQTEETTVESESTADELGSVQITTTEVLETATSTNGTAATSSSGSAAQATGRLTAEQTEADQTTDESQTTETAPSTPASYRTVALTSISEYNSETEAVSTSTGSVAVSESSAVTGRGYVNMSITDGGESIDSVTNVGQTNESSVTTGPVRTLNTPSNEIETRLDTITVTGDNSVSLERSDSSETAAPTTVSTTTTGTHTVQITQNITTTVQLSTEATSTTKPTYTTESASITPSTPDNHEHRRSAASSTVTEESPSTAGETEEPKTTDVTEGTSGSAVSEEISAAPRSIESVKRYDELYQRFLTAAVLSTVLINVVFLVVTSYSVYKIVKKHYFYSWDPPPVRYGSVDYGISMGRRNIGLDLSPETHDGIPPPPRITHENPHLKDRDSNVPIVITNEDGWCVPYAEAEDSRQLQNQKQSLEEKELQDMSQSPQHGTRKHNGGTAERNSFNNRV